MLKQVFNQVFAEHRAWLITVWSAVLFLFALVYMGNAGTVRDVLFSGIPFYSKLLILVILPGNLIVQNSPFMFVSAGLMAILFGMNIAFFAYYIRRARLAAQADIPGSVHVPYVGVGGTVAGLLSVGCASCGTFVLGYLLSLVGAGTALAVVPLAGTAVRFIGIFGLGYSLYCLAQEIEKPIVCSIDEPR